MRNNDAPKTWEEYTGVKGLPFVYEKSKITPDMLNLYFEDIYQINSRRIIPLFSYIKSSCLVAKRSILHRWIKDNINSIGLLPLRRSDTHISKWNEVNCIEGTNLGIMSLTFFLCYTRQDMRICVRLMRRKDIVKMVNPSKKLRDMILASEVLYEEDAVAFLEEVKYDALFIPMVIELTEGVVINYTRDKEWIPSYGKNILGSNMTMDLLMKSKNYEDSNGKLIPPMVIPHVWYNVCADKGLDSVYIARDLFRSPRSASDYERIGSNGRLPMPFEEEIERRKAEKAEKAEKLKSKVEAFGDFGEKASTCIGDIIRQVV